MTTTTTTTIQPHDAGKKKGVMKKVLKYLQNQAVDNSNSRSFLTPPGLEPQQKPRYPPPRSRQDKQNGIFWTQRRFSDASTAVESRRRLPGAGVMAGDGADASVFNHTDSPLLKDMKKVQYAQDNILQNYRLYVPERDPETVSGDQFWVIFIHGGYFRDPKVDATALLPALELLTSAGAGSHDSGSLKTVPESAAPSPVSSRVALAEEYDSVRRHVAGYASINYRLSPNPDYPQGDETENYVRRNARFPQHLDDVHAAIRHLQTRYGFTNNYILAGHSVGATLSFLAALKATQGQIDPPVCIVGLNGIYDFPYIHVTNPDYESMGKNAMEPDQYREASPAYHPKVEYESVQPKQTLRVLLSHSKDDELVNWDQVEKMQETLRIGDEQPRLHVELMETKGKHDQIWGEGKELARTIVEAVRMVTSY